MYYLPRVSMDWERRVCLFVAPTSVRQARNTSSTFNMDYCALDNGRRSPPELLWVFPPGSTPIRIADFPEAFLIVLSPFNMDTDGRPCASTSDVMPTISTFRNPYVIDDLATAIPSLHRILRDGGDVWHGIGELPGL